MSFTVKNNGKVLQAILGRFKDLEKGYIDVGIFSKGAGNNYDKNFAMRMAHFEKGSVKAHLPSRPVFGTTMHDRKEETKGMLNILYKKILTGKITQKEAFNTFGAAYAGMLKVQFTRRKFAALSPNYKIRPSGQRVTAGSIPLFDRGTMIGKIKHRVVL